MNELEQRLAQLFASAWLDRDVYHRDDELKLYWSTTITGATPITIRVQSPSGRIYVEAQPTIQAGFVANLGKIYQLPEGDYDVVLMPALDTYYVHGLRIVRKLPISVANGRFSSAPYGTDESRRREALEDAARRPAHLFAEIAKLELGQWAQLKQAVIQQATEAIQKQTGDYAINLVGVLSLLARYGSDPQFPPGLKTELETCVLNFDGWTSASGADNDAPGAHAILLTTAAILASQLYPTAHQPDGEQLALTWLQQQTAHNFSAGISEADIIAITHLADLATNDTVREFAAVTLDKLFFLLAVNSLRGVEGAPTVKNGRLAPTSGMARLLWGMGVFNQQSRGVVSLACARNYTLPPLIAQIATDQPAEMWHRAQYSDDNQATYKTPDFMLCSTQTAQQSSWQAIFDADAMITAIEPTCRDEGFLRQLRVAQWQDILVAVYQLADADPAAYTQVTFPAVRFDEYTLYQGWVFARRGNGYFALTTAHGVELVTEGDTAYRALRAAGPTNVWFCHLGRAALDGSFADFQTSLLALDITFEAHSIHGGTLRNQSIDFGWEGPLLIDEAEVALPDARGIENSYCVADWADEQLEIRFQDQALRLDFSN